LTVPLKNNNASGLSGEFDSKELNTKLLYGVKPDELSVVTEELILNTLLQKSAAVLKADSIHALELAQQWFWPEIQDFLLEMIQWDEKQLIFEWCTILKSKNRCLPANTLIPLMNWGLNDTGMADKLIPVLGPLGYKLPSLFDEYSLYSQDAWKDPMAFKKKNLIFFTFSQYRKYVPDDAFQYFCKNYSAFSASDKVHYLELLKPNLDVQELARLMEIIPVSNKNLQSALLSLVLSLKESEYYKEVQKGILKIQKSSDFDLFELPDFRDKKWQPSLSGMISKFPLTFFETDLLAEAYINWIETNKEDLNLMEAIKQDTSSFFTKYYFKYLLRNKRLTESIDTSVLSKNMDFAVFNECCLEWMDSEKDQLDLEAFLHFVHTEKHFWSDNLVHQLLEIRNNPSLTKKYDFDIFWQLLPFKINPNSDLVKSIPEDCRIFENRHYNFDRIIEFRKWIRKG
jgi:hypothetical protein